MNIGQAKKMLKSLIGEDCYNDISDIVNSYFDVAQKQIATTVDFIEKTFEAAGPGEVALPPGCMRIKRVSPDGSFETAGKKRLRLLEAGDYLITYYAYPQVLDEETPDSYEFEISPEALSAIVYFAAANAVITDNDMRPYYAFSDRYNNILQNISSARTGQSAVRLVDLEG